MLKVLLLMKVLLDGKQAAEAISDPEPESLATEPIVNLNDLRQVEQDVFYPGAKPSFGIQVPCSLAAKAAGLKTRSFIVNSLRYVAHTYGIIAGIPTVPRYLRYHGTVGTVDSPSLYLRYTVR